MISVSMKVQIKRSRKFWALVGGIFVLAAVLTIVGVIIYKKVTEPKSPISTAQKYVQQAEQAPLPVDDIEKVSYYANQASAYYDAGDFQKALEAYLKADSFIKNRDPKKGGTRSVYLGIGDSYAKLGDKEKAKEYYQKEIDRRKAKGSSESSISIIQKKKDEL